MNETFVASLAVRGGRRISMIMKSNWYYNNYGNYYKIFETVLLNKLLLNIKVEKHSRYFLSTPRTLQAILSIAVFSLSLLIGRERFILFSEQSDFLIYRHNFPVTLSIYLLCTRNSLAFNGRNALGLTATATWSGQEFFFAILSWEMSAHWKFQRTKKLSPRFFLYLYAFTGPQS